MKQHNNWMSLIGIAMLLFAIGFNLWLYRLEPSATTDPNDNTFQFALIDRTNTIWDFAHKQCTRSVFTVLTYPLCHFSYLSDHWVHNWAEGYNLPYYYSHIPQITIVGSYRLFHLLFSRMSLFQYYHIIIYLLLCSIPLPIFLALRVIGLSWITAGAGALFATHLSTDGLYGLDPSSFLWRGYGLSSQLFAMIWLPLALAYSYRFFLRATESGRQIGSSKTFRIGQKSFSLPQEYWNHDGFLAILFTVATTSGHLGIGMMTMMSLGFLAIASPIISILSQQSAKQTLTTLKENIFKLTIIAGTSIFILSYWIVPTFIHGNFHNMSFWDPVWKFDSYGAKETIVRLFNGDLLDFGRIPILTALTFFGIIAGLLPNVKSTSEEESTINPLSSFSFLFIFWIVFYFGRTTWGSLIDLIPGMKDFHLSRFIVGVHVTAMFLIPIGLSWCADQLHTYISRFVKFPFTRLLAYLLMGILLIPPVYRWTITYNELNDQLIVKANNNYKTVKDDEQALFARLRSLPPARIYAGRGGTYGKKFQIAETPYFMHLSTYGLPTTLWLPETWSMNSDTEQYFSEDQAKDYDLYGIRWVVAPPDEPAKPFWKFIDERPTWKLYEVIKPGASTESNSEVQPFSQAISYFTSGTRPATISVGKQNFMTVVHLWIQSRLHEYGIYPELTFNAQYPKQTGIPNFKMLDEVTYKTPDQKIHNIWAESPVYLPYGVQSLEQFNQMAVKKFDDITFIKPETVDSDMIFSTTVRVGKQCKECMVILKHTFHPGWKATIDGKPAQTRIVFPFFIGVPVSEGVHTITLSYTPSPLKLILLSLAVTGIIGVLVLEIQNNARQRTLKHRRLQNSNKG